MATIKEHAETLKRMQEDPASLGTSTILADTIIAEFKRNLGLSLVEALDRIVPVLGDIELESDFLKIDPYTVQQSLGRARRMPQLKTMTRPDPLQDTLDGSIAAGAKSISIVDRLVGSDISGTVRWAAKREGSIVVVAATTRDAQLVHVCLGEISNPKLTVLVPPPALKMTEAYDLHLDDVSTILLLDRYPQQDAWTYEFVERLRSASPDAVVVYERGGGSDRDMFGPDAVIRRTDSGYEIEEVPVPAPRF
jgi:hypothetical protein